MKGRFYISYGVAFWWLCSPAPAWAGMGSVTFSDVARVLTLSNLAKFRLDAISFFLLTLLACAWIIKRIWNSLSDDFPKLPRLSYIRALGLIGLWGLLFLLVLAMISGARELMTPGAWEKKGFTYQLVRSPDGEPPANQAPANQAPATQAVPTQAPATDPSAK